ncbi:carbohydrate porin [Bradyrhizobium sp. 62B]|uniref:carbohydrate porin n=1 Tax=Bradyrhizobium sp. 62B TaxID=2898442 RepID=UPI0035D6BC47
MQCKVARSPLRPTTTYRPRNGLEVRPNIQYVIDPGGTSQNRNALVFGLKTAANF